MEYRVAKNIRGRSLSSLITERITEGSSVGSAIGRSVTQKLKATGTGIIEKFDPLNLVKFATGGSRLAPAVLGKITGRSQKSIEYFSGDRQPTERRSYTPLSRALPKSDFGGSSLNVLNEILNFLRESNSKDIQRRETEKSFIEEKQFEQQRRHKEFIEVLKTYTSLAPAYTTPVAGKPEEKKDPTGGILDTVKKMIAAAVEGIKKLMFGMLSLVSDMIQKAISSALKIFDWINDLKWLKGIKNIPSLLSVLGRAAPVLKWLLRFAGPIALFLSIKEALDFLAANAPNIKALSPQQALNVLQGKNLQQIKDEGGYENLVDIIRNRKKESSDLLSAYEENPDDEIVKLRIRQLGGMSKVREMAESPDVNLQSIPSFKDVYGEAQEIVRPFPKDGNNKLKNDWLRNYGGIYDPETGRRLDIESDFMGPLRPFREGSLTGVKPFDFLNPASGPADPSTFIQGPDETTGQPPPRSLSTPINESDLIQTPYQFTPLPVNSQVNALSKVLDEMQLDRSGPSNAPIVSTNTRNIPLPRKPISSSATTRDDTFIFQRTIERNRARY